LSGKLAEGCGLVLAQHKNDSLQGERWERGAPLEHCFVSCALFTPAPAHQALCALTGVKAWCVSAARGRPGCCFSAVDLHVWTTAVCLVWGSGGSRLPSPVWQSQPVLWNASVALPGVLSVP